MKRVAPRVLAFLISLTLAFPPPVSALREPSTAEKDPNIRAGLEEALRFGDPDALIRVASSRLAQWIAPAPAAAPGLPVEGSPAVPIGRVRAGMEEKLVELDGSVRIGPDVKLDGTQERPVRLLEDTVVIGGASVIGPVTARGSWIGGDAKVQGVDLTDQLVVPGEDLSAAVAQGRWEALQTLTADPNGYIGGALQFGELSRGEQDSLIQNYLKQTRKLSKEYGLTQVQQKAVFNEMDLLLHHPIYARLTSEEVFRYLFALIRSEAGGNPFGRRKGSPKAGAGLRNLLEREWIPRVNQVDEVNFPEFLRELLFFVTAANLFDYQAGGGVEKILEGMAAEAEKQKPDQLAKWLEKKLEEMIHPEPALENWANIPDQILKAAPGTVVYLTDNLAEIEADAALWLFLSKRLRHRVVVAAKDQPIHSDAAKSEVEALVRAIPALRALRKEKLQVISSGSDTYGTPLYLASTELVKAMSAADLRFVISKGQGNLYTTVARNPLKVPVILLYLNKGQTAEQVTGVQRPRAPGGNPLTQVQRVLALVRPGQVAVRGYKQQTGGVALPRGSLRELMTGVEELGQNVRKMVAELAQGNLDHQDVNLELLAEIIHSRMLPEGDPLVTDQVGNFGQLFLSFQKHQLKVPGAVPPLEDELASPPIKRFTNPFEVRLRTKRVSTMVHTEGAWEEGKGPCTLCASTVSINFPSLRAYRWRNFLIWPNPSPAPGFEAHLVFASSEHTPQRIGQREIRDFLNLLFLAPQFRVFFSGTGAGASTPKHQHFHGITEPLPVEQWNTRLRTDLGRVRLLTNEGGPASYLVVEGGDLESVTRASSSLTRFLDQLRAENKIVGYNLLFTRAPEVGERGVRVFVFPRNHYTTDHQVQRGLKVGIGSLEMMGLMIANSQETFEQFTREDVEILIRQAGVKPEEAEEILRQFLVLHLPSLAQPKIRAGNPAEDSDLNTWVSYIQDHVSSNAGAVFEELTRGYLEKVPAEEMKSEAELGRPPRYYYSPASFEDSVLKTLWEREGGENRALQAHIARRIYEHGEPLYSGADLRAAPYGIVIPRGKIIRFIEQGLVRLVQTEGIPWSLTATHFRLLPALDLDAARVLQEFTERWVETLKSRGLQPSAARLVAAMHQVLALRAMPKQGRQGWLSRQSDQFRSLVEGEFGLIRDLFDALVNHLRAAPRMNPSVRKFYQARSAEKLWAIYQEHTPTLEALRLKEAYPEFENRPVEELETQLRGLNRREQEAAAGQIARDEDLAKLIPVLIAQQRLMGIMQDPPGPEDEKELGDSGLKIQLNERRQGTLSRPKEANSYHSRLSEPLLLRQGEPGVGWRRYRIHGNIFPILQGQIVIVNNTQIGDRIVSGEPRAIYPGQFMDRTTAQDMLDLAAALPGYRIFYNHARLAGTDPADGAHYVHWGASVRHHHHLQGVPFALPVESFEVEGVAQVGLIRLGRVKNYPARVLVLESENRSELARWTERAAQWLDPPGKFDPKTGLGFNVLVVPGPEGRFRVYLFPRSRYLSSHAPQTPEQALGQFGITWLKSSERGEEGLIVNPATVEMAGFLVTADPATYAQMTPEIAEEILDGVSVPEQVFADLLRAIQAGAEEGTPITAKIAKGIVRGWEEEEGLTPVQKEAVLASLAEHGYTLEKHKRHEALIRTGEQGRPSTFAAFPPTANGRSNSPERERLLEIGRRPEVLSRLGVVVAAAGEGTRLIVNSVEKNLLPPDALIRYVKPTAPVMPVTGKPPLFYQLEMLADEQKTRRVPLPVRVVLHEEAGTKVLDEIERNGRFGLGHLEIVFQGMNAGLTPEGQIVLFSDGTVVLNPDGSGGVIRAALQSGGAEWFEQILGAEGEIAVINSDMLLESDLFEMVAGAATEHPVIGIGYNYPQARKPDNVDPNPTTNHQFSLGTFAITESSGTQIGGITEYKERANIPGFLEAMREAEITAAKEEAAKREGHWPQANSGLYAFPLKGLAQRVSDLPPHHQKNNTAYRAWVGAAGAVQMEQTDVEKVEEFAPDVPKGYPSDQVSVLSVEQDILTPIKNPEALKEVREMAIARERARAKALGITLSPEVRAEFHPAMNRLGRVEVGQNVRVEGAVGLYIHPGGVRLYTRFQADKPWEPFDPAKTVELFPTEPGQPVVIPDGTVFTTEGVKTPAGAEEIVFDWEGALQIGIDAVGMQDIGFRRTQQDRYALHSIGNEGEGKPAGILAVLSDGMGGLVAGDLVSRMAVVRIPEILRATDAADLLRQYEAAEANQKVELGNKIQARLKEAVNQAHAEIRQLGDWVEEYRDAGKKPVEPAKQEEFKKLIEELAGWFGMVFDFNDPKIQLGRGGTTVVVALMSPSAAFIAAVGDSRIYLYGPGRLSQQTHDDVYYGSLSQFLGKDDELELQQRVIPLRSNDRLLLASDGLTNAVPDQKIAQILAEDPTAEGAADDLLAAAKIAHASDNNTLILLDTPLRVKLAPAPAKEEKPAPPVPAPELSETDRLILKLGLNKAKEPAMAVISYEAADQYEPLKPFIGKPPVRMGELWLFVLPQQTGTKALWELLEPALGDQLRQVRIWQYGDLSSDRSLGLFNLMARSEGLNIVAPPEPAGGRSFQSLLAGILATLRGVPPGEIGLEDTQKLEKLLALFA